MRTVRFLIFVAIVSFSAPLNASLATARQAQALLGPQCWSQVIRIENRERHSIYPKVTYGTAFEFHDILWLFTEHDGTQSLSLYQGRLERDKRDLMPLLRAIEPGFRSYSVVDSTVPQSESPGEHLPNGCFIESLAALRQQLNGEEVILHAGLLLYYAPIEGGKKGHTVLAYESSSGVYVFDPGNGPARKILDQWADDPLQLARATEPALSNVLVNARFVPVRTPSQSAGYVGIATQASRHSS